MSFELNRQQKKIHFYFWQIENNKFTSCSVSFTSLPVLFYYIFFVEFVHAHLYFNSYLKLLCEIISVCGSRLLLMLLLECFIFFTSLSYSSSWVPLNCTWLRHFDMEIIAILVNVCMCLKVFLWVYVCVA